MQELMIQMPVDYGYAELKTTRKKYTSVGMLLALFLLSIGIGSYWLTIYMTRDEEPRVTMRIRKYSELGPPPSLTSETAPAVAVSGPQVKPTIGIPVPVPDAEVSPDQTISTQQELSKMAPVGEGSGSGGQVIQDFTPTTKDDEKLLEEGPPADFVAYEKGPVAVKEVRPKYPDIAVKANIEGTVVVRAWVTKEGKVKKVVIMKSDAEILNDPAIEAAKQYVFTPALQQKKPIDVWVSIPFRFRLKDRDAQ